MCLVVLPCGHFPPWCFTISVENASWSTSDWIVFEVTLAELVRAYLFFYDYSSHCLSLPILWLHLILFECSCVIYNLFQGSYKVLNVWKMLNFDHYVLRVRNMLEFECTPWKIIDFQHNLVCFIYTITHVKHKSYIWNAEATACLII